MLQALDEAAVRAWAQRACAVLAAQRGEIDRINVFPVADGDTGSNLLATMRSGLDALGDLPTGDGLASCAETLARGALRGARGNSGVIVSQVLRGFAEGLRRGGAETCTAESFVLGLTRATELAAAAVSEPAAGTILTVLQDATAAAAEASRRPAVGVASVVDAAADGAAASLAATPGLLPDLARAGVVDAGARGLVVLLDTLAEVLSGRSVSEPAPNPDVRLDGGSCAGSAFDYEVMYLLEGCGEPADLRNRLAELGDCVVVAGSGGADPLWSVHVHCADVGAAIEAGVRCGRPSRITVLRFADQHGAVDASRGGRRGVLCLVRGAGIEELLQESGAATVPAEVSVEHLAAAIAGAGAEDVVVLVEGAEVEKARQAADATDRRVVVVPTDSAVQMISALAVHDAGRPLADDLVAMAATGASTRSARLEVAAQEALTWVGRCRPGDHLGVVDGDVTLIEPDADTAAVRLLDRLLTAGGELVTVLLGAGAPDGVATALENHARAEHPEIELVVYDGGQPDCVLLMGVE